MRAAGPGKMAAMPKVCLMLNLLGGFELRRGDGGTIDLRHKKGRALLAYLALRGGTQSRERLATLLWGDMSDERARHNLRQCVASLRQTLAVAGEVLLAEGDGLRLDPAIVEVDAVRLERLAGSADPLQQEQAAGLCAGELLAGFSVDEDAYDGWLQGERARLRDLACNTLARTARAALDRGDATAALDLARRHLVLDPACEEAYRTCMRAHAAAGRRSDAVQCFELCVSALSRQLGLAPSEETVQLRDQIAAARASAGSVTAGPPPASLPDRPSIAVLPFQNLGAEADTGYFTDGITEDLVIALSRFGSLFVIARNSSFAYRGTTDLRRVGRELGVHYLLEGSVRRAGDRLRIGVQLIDAATVQNVWAQRYERNMQDIFEMQDDVARTIVATLVNRVESAHLARARRLPPSSLAAYDLLLRGKDHHHRYTPEDNRLGHQALDRALELAPDYALAHAWLACTIAQSSAFWPDPSALDRAYVHILRACELDDGESECQRLRASYCLETRRLEEAERHQQRAFELNPNDDRIVCQNGEVSLALGRPEEGVRWVQQAMRLNPFHPDNFYYHLGRALYGCGRADEASGVFRRISSPRPSHQAFQVAALVRSGQTEAARAQAAALRQRKPDFDAGRFGGLLPYNRPEDVGAIVADLRAAGL